MTEQKKNQPNAGSPGATGQNVSQNVSQNVRPLALTEVISAIKNGIRDNGAETYLGSMVTTRGVLVLLFSHRLNKDFALLVMGSDTSKVLTKVFEALA